jgi:S-(hydroxymethyl)glutathione dehydrogenase / alcohol dehydrogenase
MKTTAAVLSGVGQPFETVEVELAPPREGEVLVRVAASGLCASDLNAVDGKRTLVPFPAVLGHEAAGIVEDVGPGVEHVRPGDHVVLSIVPSCGSCAPCLAGRPNFCATAGEVTTAGALMDGTGRLSVGGQPLHHFLTVSSFAQHAVVPASGVVGIPDQMPLDAAALISCAVLTGYGAVRNTAQVQPGARVAVIGCGGVGLNSIQGARLAGASTIVAVDVTPEKLALARTVGATEVVDASTHDPVAAIRELCGGVDYAFEALGREATVQQAWQSLDAGGTAVTVGLLAHGASLTLDAGPLVNEVTLKGCYFGSAHLARDVRALVDHYLAGELLLDEIISHRIGFDGLDDAFARMRAGKGARSVLVLD